MNGPQESGYELQTEGESGKLVRTIQVTTLVNGVLTTVDMQVMAIADAQGNVIKDFIDYNWQQQMLRELQRIRSGFQLMTGNDLNDVLP